MSGIELRERVAGGRKAAGQGLRSFYSRPLGWFALVVTAGFMAYAGGGVMFWFHALFRGEAGPPIGDWYHWMFDSTLGFVALTPALFFILPAALAALHRVERRDGRVVAAVYVAVVGVAFGVATGPGPFLHDKLVGRTAPLGRLATSLFGTDPAVAARNAHVAGHSTLIESLLQVALGVPVYVVAGLLALVAVRALARRQR